MKRLLFFIIILFAVFYKPGLLSAQLITAKGVMGGVNFANVYNNNAEDTDTRIGYTLGGFITIRAYKQFLIQPEILFSSKGFISQAGNHQSTDSASYSYKTENTFILNYIEVPVLGVVEISKHFRLYGGPYFDFFISGKKKMEFNGTFTYYDPETQQWIRVSDNDSDSEKIKSGDMNTPGFGILTGTDLIFGKFSIGARYSMGLSNAPDSKTVDFRHKLFQVLIGYSLP
ncbi:MAG TPA: porin family protein [bacterium]|nr:porin family protein [bacterium]HPN45823.1 porin family protein [bacterium]